MTHTPGPWSLDHGSTFDTDNQPMPGFAVGSAELGFTTVTIRAVGQTLTPCPSVNKLREVGLANARLIAAAPELLEALEGIAKLASCAPNDDAETAGQEFMRIMNRARAAIAKAKGEPC